MFIPDPRWEEPNLLIPGKKPTGPVVIDWSHTLARGAGFKLKHCVLTSPEPVDLVTGEVWTGSGVSPVAGGQYTDEGTSDHVFSGISQDYGSGDFSGKFSIVHSLDLSISTASSFRTFWALDKNAYNSGPFFQYRRSTNTIEVFYSGASKVQFPPFTINDGLQNIAITFGGSGGQAKIFISGRKMGTWSAGGNASGGGQAAFGSELVLNRSVGGTHHVFMVYSGELPEKLAIEISRNPYGILLPA